jgi:hypothetical protein
MSTHDWQQFVKEGAIRKALEALTVPGQTFEIRIIGPGKKARSVICHSVDEALIAVQSEPDARGYYFTLNPLPHDLGSAAKDADVSARHLLLIDIDAIRPADTNATDAEKTVALELGREIESSLVGIGWPVPFVIDSGNGGHLLWWIDLPNDVASRDLVKAVLVELARRFDTDAVKVDTTVHNASRISKLPGSMVRKGPHSEERPHRTARLIQSPPDRTVVTRAMLEALLPAQEQVPAQQPKSRKRGPAKAKAKPARAPSEDQSEDLSIEPRVIAYVAKIEPAISGQRGHDKTFGAACRVGPGFDLTEAQTFRILKDHYNPRCSPPWSDEELEHKVRDAFATEPERGWLLDRNRPAILISTEEHRNVDEAVDALASEELLFQRSGMLVTVLSEQAPKPGKRGLSRPPGSIRIAPLPNAQVRRMMSRCAAWKKRIKDRDGKAKEVPAHPPAPIVDQVATLGTWPGLRPIEGITEIPTLRPDGSLISTPGYDEDTGLWYAPNGVFPPVPENPTKEDAQRAVVLLGSVVTNFPFAGATDKEKRDQKSVWLAALLTPMARWAIDGPCPMFLFDANCPGTGKTKLCDIIAVFVTGREMPRADCPDDQVELAKQVFAIAMQGDRFLLFDNVETGSAIGGPVLDRLLTARTVQGRILGYSQMPVLPFNAVIYATGNNLGLRGDALRRIVDCRLETTEQRPEERQDFQLGIDCPCGCKGDLLNHIKQIRPELVSAALTILRAYVVAGCPDQKLTPMDYPAWSGLIRNAVKWATGHDPCAGRHKLADRDQELSAAKGLLEGWEALCKENCRQSMTAGEVLAILDKEKDLHAELREIICSWSRDARMPGPKTVGKQLVKLRGRNIGGKALHGTPYQGVVRWSVVNATKRDGEEVRGFGGFGGFDPHVRGESGLTDVGGQENGCPTDVGASLREREEINPPNPPNPPSNQMDATMDHIATKRGVEIRAVDGGRVIGPAVNGIVNGHVDIEGSF